MSNIGIHQPNFLPWQGYFRKIALCDYFVFLDNVLMPLGKSYISRNLIKMHYQKQWATVPLNKHQIPIFDVEIANNDWISKLSRSLKVAYGNTAYFSLLNEIIIPEFEKKYNHIADLNISLIIKISRWLGISKVKFIRASEMKLKKTDASSIADILDRLKAKNYVTGFGLGTKRYLKDLDLESKNISIKFISNDFLAYKQIYGSFLKNLSIIDSCVNLGPSQAYKIINTNAIIKN